MDSVFPVYLQLGIEHISDLNGYDHILFIVALCSMYSLRHWKKILILVTAFTLGHSITLALSAMRLVVVPALWIEMMIPVTILVTALGNVWTLLRNPTEPRSHYIMPLFFGFIHGMGFSNYFMSLLGQEANILIPLLAFNLGVEIGQLGIVIVFMAITFMALRILKFSSYIWSMIINAIAIALSLYLLWERIAEL
jgi:hypothetical protein